MSRSAVLVMVGGLALTTLALAGCVAADPVGTASPAPSGTSSVIDVSAPPVRFAVDCADLADSSELSQLLGTEVSPIDPLTIDAAIGTDTGAATALRALGGLSCAWSNDATWNAPGLVGVHVQGLPDASEAWGAAAMMGDPTCFIVGSTASCSADPLVGDTWLSIQLIGVPVTDGADAASVTAAVSGTIETIRAAVESAGAPAAATDPSEGVLTLEGSGAAACAQLVTDDAATAAFGGTAIAATDPSAEPASDVATAAIVAAGADALCVLSTADGDAQPVGYLRFLTGGAWALADLEAASSGLLEPLALDGLAEGDDAAIRCLDDDRCSVLVARSGSLVEATVTRGGGVDDAGSLRDVATALGQAIVTSTAR